jgi:hypothetical protein
LSKTESLNAYKCSLESQVIPETTDMCAHTLFHEPLRDAFEKHWRHCKTTQWYPFCGKGMQYTAP